MDSPRCPAIGNDSATLHRERKRIVRLLLTHVTAHRDDTIAAECGDVGVGADRDAGAVGCAPVPGHDDPGGGGDVEHVAAPT